MRCYVTILDEDIAILPFFVRHYRRLGASLFPVSVWGNLERNHNTHAAARSIIEAEGGEYLELGSFPQTEFAAYKREGFIRSQHPAGEWAFFCDVDEFAEIDASFVWAVVNGLRPCSFVEGRWRDRVGAGGKLVDVDPLATLESQFPLASRPDYPLQKLLRFGGPCYVLSPFAPGSHHPDVCKIGQKLRGTSLRVTVHHFKWQANVIRRLRRRHARIKTKGKKNSSWAARVKRKLNHLKKHRGIRPDWLVEVGSILGI